jgi:hypothetical protein
MIAPFSILPRCLMKKLLLVLFLTLVLSGAESPVPPAARVTLWNGRNLAGWIVYVKDTTVDPTSVWKATDGVLRLDTKASGYLKTEKSFSNYHLHVEWRWPKDAPPTPTAACSCTSTVPMRSGRCASSAS